MKKMISSLGALFVCAFYSFSAHAFNPPSYCVFGTSGDLTIEGPTYVPIGVTRRFKGDLPFYLPPRSEDVDFHNSEQGFVGTDDTNFEGNTFHDMTFFNRGVKFSWVDIPVTRCSKMTVYVQDLPVVVSASIAPRTDLLTGNYNAVIDPFFSKNAVEGNGQPTVHVSMRNLSSGITTTTQVYSNSFSLRPEFNGEHIIRLLVSDGVYSTSKNLGHFFYNGGTFCSGCVNP